MIIYEVRKTNRFTDMDSMLFITEEEATLQFNKWVRDIINSYPKEELDHCNLYVSSAHIEPSTCGDKFCFVEIAQHTL